MRVLEELFPGPSDNVVFVMVVIGLLLLRCFIGEGMLKNRNSELDSFYRYYSKRNNLPPWF